MIFGAPKCCKEICFGEDIGQKNIDIYKFCENIAKKKTLIQDGCTTLQVPIGYLSDTPATDKSYPRVLV